MRARVAAEGQQRTTTINIGCGGGVQACRVVPADIDKGGVLEVGSWKLRPSQLPPLRAKSAGRRHTRTDIPE